PKQLLSLVSNKTLLEETLARLDGLIPPERILILTNTEQESAVRKLLGNFPKENIVAEPAKRDTAAAIALGTGWVALRDHAATMAAPPSRSRHQKSTGLSGTAPPCCRRGRRDKRACDHRYQTDMGVSRIRLHRAGQADTFAQASRQRRNSSRRALSRKTKS